jgi:predicted NBD/HSP70 family sugar kinase
VRLAQLWATRSDVLLRELVFVSVSDGVGVGIVVNGEVLRGVTTPRASLVTCR